MSLWPETLPSAPSLFGCILDGRLPRQGAELASGRALDLGTLSLISELPFPYLGDLDYDVTS